MKNGYAVANGIRLFYVEEGEGPLVILCHGFPESWYSWRHQIGPLADAGFRVVAIDMPGYGRSDKPDVTYDMEWLAACIAGLIEALGHERAVLAGHDWGGLVVWPFARMHPEKTAGIIGLNTPDLPRTPMPLTELLRQLSPDRPLYIVQFQERGAAEFFAELDIDNFIRSFFLGIAVRKEVFTDEVFEVYTEPFRTRGAITPPLEYYRNLDRNWAIAERHEGTKIDVPCLMITVDGDPVLSPGLAEGMEERVPDVEIVLIEDCGHWTQQEQPEATTGHMLRYLRRMEPWD